MSPGWPLWRVIQARRLALDWLASMLTLACLAAGPLALAVVLYLAVHHYRPAVVSRGPEVLHVYR